METLASLGKYQIRRKVGAGAVGTVYEAWDPVIARQVAVKAVPLPDAADVGMADSIARFQREAQAAGRLNHPNIVAVYDYGEADGLAYIVMEFVEGGSLKERLDRNERFSSAAVAEIISGVLAGLQFSHEHGVVHRDIKPSNLMLTGTGQVKIADFGIARLEGSSMTQTGTVLGTPAYMSPEQISGQVADARSDVFSCGAVLYQLLTGERPFEGGTSAIMAKVLYSEPLLPSWICVTSPKAFDGVVRKALAKRPEDRFASAAAFALAVREAEAGRGLPEEQGDDTKVAGVPPSLPPPQHAAPSLPAMPPAAGRKSAAPLVVVAIAMVVLLLAGGLLVFGDYRLPFGLPSIAGSSTARKAEEEKAAAEAARKAAEAKAAAEVERKAAEAKAAAEVERKAAEAKAAAEVERKAAAATVAAETERRAAQAKAAAEAERKAAEAERKATAANAAAEAERKAAEEKAAAGVAAGQGASDETAAQIAVRWGIVGIWQRDCNAPISRNNDQEAFVLRNGDLYLDRSVGDAHDSNQVITASINARGELDLRVVFPSFKETRQNVHAMMRDGRDHIVTNRDVGSGEYSVRNGILLSNGRSTPLMSRCD